MTVEAFGNMFDQICSRKCLNAVAKAFTDAEKNCETADQKQWKSLLKHIIKDSISMDCMKCNGVFCAVNHFSDAKAANKTMRANPFSDKGAKYLCSPCLKKRAEMMTASNNQYQAKLLNGTDEFGWGSNTKVINELVASCPAESLDTRSSSFSLVDNPLSSSGSARFVAGSFIALITIIVSFLL